MTKTDRYNEFDQFPHCYQYQYQDPDISLDMNMDKKIILELGCGSGNYTFELAKLHPENQYVGIDTKSDRLHFGAKRSLDAGIENTKRLRAQVDHLAHCFPPQSIDEMRITFPDPWPGRDRQKLTSGKYLAIYKGLLKPGGIIHVKTDDKDFFDYSLQSLQDNEFTIIRKIEDIYNSQFSTCLPVGKVLNSQGNEELMIQTFYEQQWLKVGRKVYYAMFQFA